MNSVFLLIVLSLYLAILFYIAHWAEKNNDSKWTNNPYVYSLSLAVYCTAWTYYGSVGVAADNGLNFLPIYGTVTQINDIGNLVWSKRYYDGSIGFHPCHSWAWVVGRFTRGCGASCGGGAGGSGLGAARGVGAAGGGPRVGGFCFG